MGGCLPQTWAVWVAGDDRLYTHLLPSSELPVGYGDYIWVRWDNAEGGNYFDGVGTQVGVWTDPLDGAPRNFDLVYNFNDIPGLVDTFEGYAKDGYFGFGLDPDCHYYNDGVQFEVTYEWVPVPEPMTLSLLGIGLLGFLSFKKKK